MTTETLLQHLKLATRLRQCEQHGSDTFNLLTYSIDSLTKKLNKKHANKKVKTNEKLILPRIAFLSYQLSEIHASMDKITRSYDDFCEKIMAKETPHE